MIIVPSISPPLIAFVLLLFFKMFYYKHLSGEENGSENDDNPKLSVCLTAYILPCGTEMGSKKMVKNENTRAVLVIFLISIH
ncbi:MAG: hypothetical protein D3903_14695 [Candidatus Electrothrix sp. GM3_4]|nr:hypothetical protein [Candidatus Electrothrix sp. GM3_4]